MYTNKFAISIIKIGNKLLYLLGRVYTHLYVNGLYINLYINLYI